MRLGLIGTGKQGQRYLMEKNGGRHIVRSGSREIDYDGLEGVIIATHPAGHKKLALECIERGLPVLVEKPLALTLADCEEILDAAERTGVRFQVAHTHLFADSWTSSRAVEGNVYVDVRFTGDERDFARDYPVWIDWGPHMLAMAASLMPEATSLELNDVCRLSRWAKRRIFVAAVTEAGPFIYTGKSNRWPMARMLDSFIGGYDIHPLAFHRRVYRALFSEEHGQGSK